MIFRIEDNRLCDVSPNRPWLTSEVVVEMRCAARRECLFLAHGGRIIELVTEGIVETVHGGVSGVDHFVCGPDLSKPHTIGETMSRAATNRPARQARPASTDTPSIDPATDVATGEAVDVAASALDGADAVAVTWADAVPWLALQVGSRPSPPEVALAVPVWQMLHDSPGATVLQMAADAELRGVSGMEPTLMSRVLSRYQRAGIVRAEANGVTRWFAIDPGAIVADAQAAISGAAGSDRQARGAGAGAARPGGVRAAVAELLAAHPFEEWAPSRIARELGNSAGAVANAVEKLVADGAVIRTSQTPRRYQHAPTEKAAQEAAAPAGEAGGGADSEARTGDETGTGAE